MPKGINLQKSTEPKEGPKTREELVNNNQINELRKEIIYLIELIIITKAEEVRNATCDSIYEAITGKQQHGEAVDNMVKEIINNFIKKIKNMNDTEWANYYDGIKENLGINDNTEKKNIRSIRLSTLTEDKLNNLIENDNIPGAQEIANNLENYTLTEYLVMTLTILGVFHNIPKDKIKKILKEQKINRKVDIENLCELSSNVNNSRGKHGYRDLQEKVAEYFGIDI